MPVGHESSVSRRNVREKSLAVPDRIYAQRLVSHQETCAANIIRIDCLQTTLMAVAWTVYDVYHFASDMSGT